jgi:hypothetical protein
MRTVLHVRFERIKCREPRHSSLLAAARDHSVAVMANDEFDAELDSLFRNAPGPVAIPTRLASTTAVERHDERAVSAERPRKKRRESRETDATNRHGAVEDVSMLTARRAAERDTVFVGNVPKLVFDKVRPTRYSS